MPDRSYAPHQPPRAVDRLMHHPYEVVFAHWFILCGLVLLLGLFWPQAPAPSPSVAALPPWMIVPLALTLTAGGALTMVGLVGWPSPAEYLRARAARCRAARAGTPRDRLPPLVFFDQFDDLRVAWWYERLGLGFSAAAWISYALAVLYSYPSSLISWTLGFVFAVAAVARFLASFLIENAAKASVRRYRRANGSSDAPEPRA